MRNTLWKGNLEPDDESIARCCNKGPSVVLESIGLQERVPGKQIFGPDQLHPDTLCHSDTFILMPFACIGLEGIGLGSYRGVIRSDRG
jgi:hypothetical protein